ncbi:MAG: hypothetical protein EBV07_01220 [Proteobacteria bacterium]|nr:hypothetical protein [Pseudomonadota bacterium]
MLIIIAHNPYAVEGDKPIAFASVHDFSRDQDLIQGVGSFASEARFLGSQNNFQMEVQGEDMWLCIPDYTEFLIKKKYGFDFNCNDLTLVWVPDGATYHQVLLRNGNEEILYFDGNGKLQLAKKVDWADVV